jgi:putative transposase
MPRRPRVVIPGVPHHITQRGNNRQRVFLAPDDCRRYLDLLGHHASQYGARILGYCLMTNHIHLIAIPEKEDSLARTLGRTHSEYALALNQGEGSSGHVWQGRFFSCPMDESHLLTAMRYVDLNPVRANLAAAPWDWRWSSAHAHTLAGAVDTVLDCHWMDYFDRWNFGEWKQELSECGSDAELDEVRRATHTGEPLGSREFIAGLERQTGRRLRVAERGRPRKMPQSSEEAAPRGCLVALSS